VWSRIYQRVPRPLLPVRSLLNEQSCNDRNRGRLNGRPLSFRVRVVSLAAKPLTHAVPNGSHHPS
jgi:hypothetical protein